LAAIDGPAKAMHARRIRSIGYDGGMRYLLILLVVACGSVKNESNADAPAAIDGLVCSIHDTVDSCGAACSQCRTTSDREMPTCNGTACGVTCRNTATCTDMSCSKIAFGFDVGIEGARVVAPTGQQVAARAFQGSQALAFDVPANLQQIEFYVPVCITGTINLSARMLKARVFLEGGVDPGDQYYIQGLVPTPGSLTFLTTISAAHNVLVNYAAPMSGSTSSNIVKDVGFRIGTYGAPFTGTVWVDDLKIE
jgi:hypothetical protein